MYRKHLIFVAFSVFVLACAISLANAQLNQAPSEALTNHQIVQMVKAKVPAEEIIAKIKHSRCHFDTTPTILDELEHQGVPAEVVSAMSEAPFGEPAKPQTIVETPRVEQIRVVPTQDPNSARETHDTHTVKGNTVATATPATQVSNAAVTIPVTGDLADEITLGFSQQKSILSSYAIIKGTPTANLAQLVFANLRATAAFNGAPSLPYDIEVIERSDANAFNTMGGHVLVTSGLAELIGESAGLWAAVEGHEIAHNIYRHVYRSYLREQELQRQINYWRYRIALGDQSANWGLLAAVTAGKLLNKKLERNDENDADQLGLRMMVEAGYHPDFAINLFRILKSRSGEQSKFGALFSDHPRFITREEHIRKLYPEALARFKSMWPDAATSPGGRPPIIATLAKVSSKQDKTNNAVLLQLSYSIHNATGREVDAVFLFSLKGQQVPSIDSTFQGKNGSLVAIKRFIPTSDDESSQLAFVVPTSALGTQQHKLKARGCLLSKNEILECSKEFDVSFPSH